MLTRQFRREITAILANWRKYTVNKRHSCILIQKWWKSYTTIDPLTLDRIGTGPAFIIERYGVMHAYDAKHLANYINRSGDFNDPQTRTPYASHELRRLDRLTGNRFILTRETLIRDRNYNESQQGLVNALYNELIATIEHSRMLVENSEEVDGVDVFKDVFMPIIVQSVDNLRVVDEARNAEVLREVYNTVYETFDSSEVRESLLVLLYILRHTTALTPMGI